MLVGAEVVVANALQLKGAELDMGIDPSLLTPVDAATLAQHGLPQVVQRRRFAFHRVSVVFRRTSWVTIAGFLLLILLVTSMQTTVLDLSDATPDGVMLKMANKSHQKEGNI